MYLFHLFKQVTKAKRKNKKLEMNFEKLENHG